MRFLKCIFLIFTFFIFPAYERLFTHRLKISRKGKELKTMKMEKTEGVF